MNDSVDRETRLANRHDLQSVPQTCKGNGHPLGYVSASLQLVLLQLCCCSSHRNCIAGVEAPANALQPSAKLRMATRFHDQTEIDLAGQWIFFSANLDSGWRNWLLTVVQASNQLLRLEQGSQSDSIREGYLLVAKLSSLPSPGIIQGFDVLQAIRIPELRHAEITIAPRNALRWHFLGSPDPDGRSLPAAGQKLGLARRLHPFHGRKRDRRPVLQGQEGEPASWQCKVVWRPVLYGPCRERASRNPIFCLRRFGT
mmetsp:Transcript_36088/g.83120  ORF Transcript_36088/g.83120 Transcript_36088/m.83120 type:complete len:256 (+) Transcript_36088:570-1337(+)